jgi:hypothetical protein
MSRERFQALLTERQQLRDTLYVYPHPLDTEYSEVVIAEARKLHPKRKCPDAKKARLWLGEERFAEIFNVFKKRADDLTASVTQRTAEIDKELAALAADLTVEPGEWHELTTTWDSTFRTQGFSADKYAEGSAQLSADTARHHGVAVEVRRTTDPAGYTVMVQVREALDVEILKLKSPPSLRESVRLCWKRGVNPRVFNPFLPPGYEETAGLDYFGNNTAARAP